MVILKDGPKEEKKEQANLPGLGWGYFKLAGIMSNAIGDKGQGTRLMNIDV